MTGAIVLTGATTGIGRATAPVLAGRTDRGGRLILHGLEPESEVSDLLGVLRGRLRPGAELFYFAADFGDPAQVARLVDEVRGVTDQIDLLINNAGRPGPPARTLTADGNEVTFQTNYLAPVALTGGLLDLISGRVVNIASATHETAVLHLDDLTFAHHAYSPSTIYAHSKLALVIYSRWLAEHRPTASMEVVSMHPGVIATRLLHQMFSVGGDPPEHAAANLVHVAYLSGDNGTYYDERTPAPPHPDAVDAAMQDRLRDITLRLLRRRAYAGHGRSPA